MSNTLQLPCNSHCMYNVSQTLHLIKYYVQFKGKAQCSSTTLYIQPSRCSYNSLDKIENQTDSIWDHTALEQDVRITEVKNYDEGNSLPTQWRIAHFITYKLHFSETKKKKKRLPATIAFHMCKHITVLSQVKGCR